MQQEWKPYQCCRLFNSYYLSFSCSYHLSCSPYSLPVLGGPGLAWFTLVSYSLWSMPHFRNTLLSYFFSFFWSPLTHHSAAFLMFFSLSVFTPYQSSAIDPQQYELIYSTRQGDNILSSCQFKSEVFLIWKAGQFQKLSWLIPTSCICMCMQKWTQSARYTVHSHMLEKPTIASPHLFPYIYQCRQ